MFSKKQIITLVLLMGAAMAGIFAQERELPPPEERAELQVTRMKEYLDLTEGQEEEVYAISLDAAHVD